MDVLILGLSSIVQRRVVAALRSLPTVQHIDLGTRKAADPEMRGRWAYGEAYEDYALALARTNAELVYVSLVNSEHEKWAEAAIAHGHHVVVDKPAFLGCDRAERMLALAARRGVCLSEATVFAYHPQIAAVKELFEKAGCTVNRITAAFSFPPMEADNFRYRRSLGGGALWDQGPYAAAAGRVFFGEEPASVFCQALARGGPENVEVAFSVLGAFTGGRSLVGSFGFDTVYHNRMDLLGPEVAVELDRAFTTPPDLANTLRVTGVDGPTTVSAPAGDSFALFLGHVLDRIAARDWSPLASDLYSDARTLDRLRAAAGVL